MFLFYIKYLAADTCRRYSYNVRTKGVTIHLLFNRVLIIYKT